MALSHFIYLFRLKIPRSMGYGGAGVYGVGVRGGGGGGRKARETGERETRGYESFALNAPTK